MVNFLAVPVNFISSFMGAQLYKTIEEQFLSYDFCYSHYAKICQNGRYEV